MKAGHTIRIAIAIVAVSLMQTHGNASSAGLAEIGKAFPHLPQTTISLVMTTVGLAIVPAMLIAGNLVRKVGEKRLIMIGFSMMLVFGIASFFIRDFTLLIAARILTGFGTGLATPFQASLIPHHFTGYSAQRLFGIQSATVSLLGVLFGLAGGALAAVKWNYGFAVYLVAIPALILIGRWLPAHRSVEPSPGDAEQRFRVDRPILFLAGMMFLFGVLLFQFVTGIAYLLVERNVGGAATAGTCVALFSGGAFLSSLLYGRVQKRFGFHAVPVAMLLAVAGLLVVGIGAWTGAPLPVYLLGSVITGSSLGTVMPSVANRLTHLYKASNPSMAIAIVMGSFFLATLLSPFVLRLVSSFPGGDMEAGRFVYAGAGMALVAALVRLTWKKAIHEKD